jgi:hypothetical protein
MFAKKSSNITQYYGDLIKILWHKLRLTILFLFNITLINCFQNNISIKHKQYLVNIYLPFTPYNRLQGNFLEYGVIYLARTTYDSLSLSLLHTHLFLDLIPYY